MTTRQTRAMWAIQQLVFFLLAGCSEPPPLPGYEPDPMLVATAPDPSLIVELPSQPGVRAPVNLALMLVREGEPAGTAERLANSVSGSIAGGIRDLGIYQLQLSTRSIEQLDAALATLVADPAVVTAGYDLVMEPRDCPAVSDVDGLLFPDSCAWDTAHGQPAMTAIAELDVELSAVSVGLIDTGVAWRNGEFDVVRLIDAKAAGGRPDGLSDSDGHGTAVAGVIAADDGDGGLNGIASRALGSRLRLVVSAINPSPIPLVLAAQMMVESQRAIGAGATIINWSMGVSPLTQPLSVYDRAALDLLRTLAMNRSQVLFVAAAGNTPYELTDSNDLPAGIALPNVITVGSHLGCMPRTRAPLSSFGPLVEITAQGDDMCVIGLEHGAAWGSGTSFAAPQVTALAAILKSIDPSLSAAELKQRILDGAQPGPATTSGRALDLARPILQLLRDQRGADPLLDADEDGHADAPGTILTRLCGGSTYSVDDFGTYTYLKEPEDGAFVTGNLNTHGFGLALGHEGSDSLGMVCDGCAFQLGSFPIMRDGPMTVAHSRGAGASAAGFMGISGSWSFDKCVIVRRYPEFFSPTDTPMTVLLSSTATGELEGGDGTTEEPVVTGFSGAFEIPATVEPLEPGEPLIQTIESSCEGGRDR